MFIEIQFNPANGNLTLACVWKVRTYGKANMCVFIEITLKRVLSEDSSKTVHHVQARLSLHCLHYNFIVTGIFHLPKMD